MPIRVHSEPGAYIKRVCEIGAILLDWSAMYRSDVERCSGRFLLLRVYGAIRNDRTYKVVCRSDKDSESVKDIYSFYAAIKKDGVQRRKSDVVCFIDGSDGGLEFEFNGTVVTHDPPQQGFSLNLEDVAKSLCNQWEDKRSEVPSYGERSRSKPDDDKAVSRETEEDMAKRIELEESTRAVADSISKLLPPDTRFIFITATNDGDQAKTAYVSDMSRESSVDTMRFYIRKWNATQ